MMSLDLSRDFEVFDFKRDDLWLLHQDKDTVTIDHTNTKFTNHQQETQLKNCLVRQISDRTIGTVRQVFERGRSITADSIQIQDTIIEVPIFGNAIPAEGDTIERRVPGDQKALEKWMVLAVDSATNNTRTRTACRRVK